MTVLTMDEYSIEAEIQKELDGITDIDDEGRSDEGGYSFEEDIGENSKFLTDDSESQDKEENVLPSMQEYVNKIQSQSKQLELELMECDDLLQETNIVSSRSTYDDDLISLAQQKGVDVDALKLQVLKELEEEDKREESLMLNNVAEDVVTDLLGQAQMSARDQGADENNGGFFVTTNAEVKETGDIKRVDSPHKDHTSENADTEIKPATEMSLSVVNTEDGMVVEKTADDQKELMTDTQAGVVAQVFDSDQLERRLLKEVLEIEQHRKQLEQERHVEISQRKIQEDEREKQLEEKRKMKQDEIKQEEEKLNMTKQQKETDLQKETETFKKQIEQSLEEYEKEINEIAKQTAKEKEDWQKAMKDEQVRQEKKKQKAAIKIQALYRGYSVRKVYGEETRAVIQELREERHEQRIAEVQILIDEREELKRCKEEEEALLKAEEEKRKRLEEEEKTMKIEEEKRRKEQEKQRKLEEARLKKEEEKRKKEEEKRRKEEEKKKKEEEEKQRKEEEKRKKEEEKRKKEEEKRKKKEEEEERKRKELEEKIRKEEEERLKQINKELEEQKKKELEERKLENEEQNRKNTELINATSNNEDMNINNKNGLVNGEHNAEDTKFSKEINTPRKSKDKADLILSLPNGDIDVVGQHYKPNTRGMTELFIDTVSMANNVEPDGKKVQKSPRKTPRPPSAPRPPSVQKVPGLVYDRPNSAKSRNSVKNSTNNIDSELIVNSSHQEVSHTPVRIAMEDNTRQSIKSQHELAKSRDWGEYLPQPIEQKRLAWIKDCKPISKIFSNQKSRKTQPSKKPPRRPTSAKKLPELDQGLILAAANAQSLKQVTTVELQDLPGCTLKSMVQCVHLKSLCMENCNLVTTEGLEQCKNLYYLNLKKNKLEVVSLRDLESLIYLDVSHNSLTSIHGLDGCSDLRFLDMSNNKITRIGGLDSLIKLHTLSLNNNQLITSRGLSEAPTIQCLDLSQNHLPSVDDLDKLALLQQLTVSSNSLMQVPKLTNHVLLNELVLNDNSISFLSSLTQTWLPMLATLNLSQNSISMLDPMLNLLLLENLHLSHNQIIDMEHVLGGFCATRCLLLLSMEGNPFCEEQDYSDKIQSALPYLKILDSKELKPTASELKRTEFERLCMTQSEQIGRLKKGYMEALGKCTSTLEQVEIHTKYFNTSHQLATDVRYTHEYGISMVKPKEIDMNFDIDPKDISKTKELVLQTPTQSTTVNVKSKFENSLKGNNNHSTNFALDMKSKFEQTLQNKQNAIHHPASPTPKAMFEQNITKTMSQANQASRQTPTNVVSSADAMKSKFDLALMKANSSPQQQDTRTNGHVGINGHSQHEVKSSKSFTTNIDAGTVSKLLHGDQPGSVYHNTAIKIQAWWRGNYLRKQLEIAYNYVRFDDLDEDLENFAEIDLGEFDKNLDDWEQDLLVPDTPQIPSSHPILGKPPSHPTSFNSKPPSVPHLFDKHPQPPDNPKHAWRNADSSLSEHSNFGGKPLLPPLSRMSDGQSCDTQRTKKSERLADEWGFKDSKTAELMYARAKKLKYNAAKRKKLSQLDPRQRLALFRKLEETTRIRPVQPAARKHMPRKEYFQAREQEVRKQEFERHIEKQDKSDRTFEWVHTQVGSHDLSSSRIQKGAGIYGSEGNLPRMDPGVVAGGRTHLINSPVSMDLQSVESASTFGEPHLKPRKLSQNSQGDRLPPIRNNSNSAPSVKAKERMSFRNPKTENDIGWGGGRKRNKVT